MSTSHSVLTLGHSPDPDDAFMFYALAEHKIDTGTWRFEHFLQDIQTLNERATRGELHISAISIHAYAYVLDKYALLPSGASMGDGYGPMLIVRNDHWLPDVADLDATRKWLLEQTIAVPGRLTSAFLALQIFLGVEPKIAVVPFDEIFDYVREGFATVGLYRRIALREAQNDDFGPSVAAMAGLVCGVIANPQLQHAHTSEIVAAQELIRPEGLGILQRAIMRLRIEDPPNHHRPQHGGIGGGDAAERHEIAARAIGEDDAGL